MLITIFSTLYELFAGENQQEPAFRNGIFNPVGLLTLFGALVICIIFYLVLGRWKSVWHTPAQWAITAAISAAMGFAIAYTVSSQELGYTDSYVTVFAALNGIFASIIFMGLSFFLKNFSIHAKRTPC